MSARGGRKRAATLQPAAGARVTVLHGAVPPEAPPDEQDTLVQAAAVTAALQRGGFAAEPLAATLNLEALRAELIAREPALVFNLVESLAGSGRLIPLVPALLEELRLPYTGAPLGALFLSSNKLLAKRLLALQGVPTPAWIEPGASGAPGASPPAGAEHEAMHDRRLRG